jgi:xanthine dehydrogenase iron-sulfur cluster and FAD-binding subunit A
MGDHARQHHHAHDMTNSHLLVQAFDYYEPSTLAEALSLLSQCSDRAHVMAGGTNLIVWMKMEQVAPEVVINIGHLPGLQGVAARDDSEDGLEVGALTRIWDLRNSPLLQFNCTALAEACAAFGSTQIQYAGTIGGNICNGSPASDTVPALMALGAELVLIGPEGERVVPIEDFLLGPGKTALRPGEILTFVMLRPLTHPASRATQGSAFVKISRVRADLAKASAAAVVLRDGERIVGCRLAFGSVGPTVVRCRRAEELVTGETLTAELALEAGKTASEEVAPIDDIRSTAWYRREVVKALTHDVLQLAWERAGGQRRVEAEEQGSTGPKERSTARAVGHALHVSRFAHRDIQLTVNGAPHHFSVKPNELLLNVLRERLHLTGAKYGCGLGECGACTVHVDGVPTLGCLTLAVAADGREVTTVEGLQGRDGELDPLQEAFVEQAAFQCGYCTPGMLMMTKRLLAEIPSPSEDDIRDYLKGNRCRCTGFAAIVRAVMSCGQNEP